MRKKLVGSVLKVLAALLVFALTLLPAVYINSIYGYLPILFLVFVLAASVIAMVLVRGHIYVESDADQSECERGKSVTVGLRIINDGRIMCPKAIANLFISNLFGETDTVTKTWMTLAPKTSNQLGFDMDMPHIGVYHVGVRNMQIFDFFGFFHLTVPVDGEFEVFVKPKIFPVEELLNNEVVQEEAPRDRRTAVLNGSDYVGVREYEMGDSMKSIHWKLSSRGLGYMTKVYESAREMDFSIVLDFAAERQETAETAMDIYDSLVETALSVVNEISKKHTSYRLIYCDKRRNIKRATPKGRGDDVGLLRDFSVLKENPSTLFPDACQILMDEAKSANRSSNVIVCTSRVTDALLQEIVRIKRQHRMPELYLIVPAAYNSRDIEKLRAKLSVLDESNIYYQFVYTTDAGGMG